MPAACAAIHWTARLGERHVNRRIQRPGAPGLVPVRPAGYTDRVPDVTTWIALPMGAYGAALSTYSAVSRRKESKRELARGLDVVVRTRVLAGPPAVPVTRYTRL